MEISSHGKKHPLLAVISANSLVTIGLRHLLEDVMPSMTLETFSGIEQLREADPDRFFHYFVDISIFLSNRAFFVEHQRRTIVLTTSFEHSALLSGFHCICVAVPEKQLIRSLLMLQQQGHPHGRHLPPSAKNASVLSPREIEVLSLVAQGFINKEIADRLHISLSTVITHRKNVTEKLGIRTVSALTMYAVMNGYVEMDKI